jgi:hypothetical protein
MIKDLPEEIKIEDNKMESIYGGCSEETENEEKEKLQMNEIYSNEKCLFWSFITLLKEENYNSIQLQKLQKDSKKRNCIPTVLIYINNEVCKIIYNLRLFNFSLRREMVFLLLRKEQMN